MDRVTIVRLPKLSEEARKAVEEATEWAKEMLKERTVMEQQAYKRGYDAGYQNASEDMEDRERDEAEEAHDCQCVGIDLGPRVEALEKRSRQQAGILGEMVKTMLARAGNDEKMHEWGKALTGAITELSNAFLQDHEELVRLRTWAKYQGKEDRTK